MRFPTKYAPRSFGGGYVVALGLALGAALTSLVLLWFVSWNAPMYEAAPEPIFSIGPLAPGGSVEQEFEVAGSFMTGVEFFAHADTEQDLPASFIARLYEGGAIIRQDDIESRIGPNVESVHWDFDAVVNPVGRRFRLQVVVGEEMTRPVFLMASLTDMLPGSAVTNGVPTGAHIDLAVLPWREIRRLNTLLATAASLPGGIAGLAVLMLGVGGGLGYVMAAVARSSRRWETTAWLVLGLSVAGLVLIVELHQLGELSLPERHFRLWPGFFRTVGLLAGTALAAVLARPIAGMIDNVSNSPGAGPKGWRERSLVSLVFVAVLMTLLAGVAYALDGPEIVYVQVLVFESGHVSQGDVGLLGHDPARVAASVATVVWVAVGAGALLYQMSIRRREIT